MLKIFLLCHLEFFQGKWKEQFNESLINQQKIGTLIQVSPKVQIFLEKRGEGIHHIGYRVENCQKALDSLVAAGGKAIDQEPRPGSRGTTVAFIHPKGSFGTLIELVQENPEE